MSESVELRPWLDGNIPAGRGPGNLLSSGRADVEVRFIEIVGEGSGRAYYPADSSNEIVAPVMEGKYFADAICPALLGSDGRIAVIYPPLAWPEGGDPLLVGDAEVDRARVQQLAGEAKARADAAHEAFDEFVPSVNEELLANQEAAAAAAALGAQAKADALAAVSKANSAVVTADEAKTAADTAQTDATGAQSVAQQAKTAADTAKATADMAASDLLTLAGKSGRVIRSTTAPTGTDRNSNNLWLNTTSGQLSEWTGSAWTLITDSRLTAATNAAASAQTKADQAVSASGAAQERADLAKSLADAANLLADIAGGKADTARRVAENALVSLPNMVPPFPQSGSVGSVTFEDGVPRTASTVGALTFTTVPVTPGMVVRATVEWDSDDPARNALFGLVAFVDGVWESAGSGATAWGPVSGDRWIPPVYSTDKAPRVKDFVVPDGVTAARFSWWSNTGTGNAWITKMSLQDVTEAVRVDADTSEAKAAAATADNKAIAAQAAATAAGSSAASAQSKADSAFANAATAQSTADQAKTAASSAQTKADTAAADLLALAGKSGRLIRSAIAPTSADDKNVNNLWLNTSNGQLSQWTGSAWTVITDSRLTAATNAAAAAQSTADTAKTNAATAQAKADSAFTNAATAKTAADNAMAAALGAQAKADTADGKATTADGRVTVGSANPVASDGVGKPVNAIWEVKSGSTVLRRFMWTGSAWTQVKAGQDFIGENAIGTAQIADLAVGTAQVADLAITNGKVGTLAASKIDAALGMFTTATIQSLVAARAFIDSLVSNGILVTPGQLLMNTSFGGGWNGNTGTSSVVLAPVAAPSGGPAAVIPAGSSATYGPYYGNKAEWRIPVSGGDSLVVSCQVFSETAIPANGLTCGTQRWDAAGTRSASSVAFGKAVPANTWTSVTFEVSLPASACSFGIYFGAAASHAGVTYVGDVSVVRKVGTVLIENGAVSADKLAATIALVTRLIAGPEDGFHVELDQTGVHFHSLVDGVTDPVEMLQINTPGTDQGEGNVFALRNPTDLESLSMSINEAGQTSTADLTVANLTQLQDVTIRGRTLEAMIEAASPRLVLDGRLLGSEITGAWPDGTASANIARLAAVSIANPYDYAVTIMIQPTVVPVYAGGNMVIRAYWNYTVGDSPADPGKSYVSAKVSGSVRTGAAGDKQVIVPAVPITIPAGQRVKAHLLCYGHASTGGTYSWTVPSAEEIVVQASVMGALDPDWDTVLSYVDKTPTEAVTPPAVKKTYTKTLDASWLATYPANSFYAGKATQGTYNGTTYTGVIGFPDLTGELAGSTVNEIQVYLYFSHWYWNSGGEALIALSPHLNQPGSASGLTAWHTKLSTGKPGDGWVKLDPSVYAQFKSGAYRGIALIGSGQAAYGTCTAAKIWVKYTK